ncbi:MAG: diguanylate cyclase [Luteimonas sp.]
MGEPGAGTDRGDAGAGSRASLQRILARVSREALQDGALDGVMQRIVDVVAAELPVAVVSIILLDEAGEAFVQEVSAGTFDLSPASWPWPLSIGAAGRCARLGAPQLIVDVDADADYLAGNQAVRSEYLVPIRHRARLHGVLNIESADSAFFDDDMREAFDAIADQIAGAIHFARIAAALEDANARLQQMSMVDGLTGIANRRAFDQALEAMLRRLRSAGQPMVLLLADADYFKALNDALGHLQGDECLRAIAGVCADAATDADGLAARFGGEEFAVLLPGHDAGMAWSAAEGVRAGVEALAMAHPSSSLARVVTVSVGGVVSGPDDTRSARALIDVADRALYVAKASGRNRVQI